MAVTDYTTYAEIRAVLGVAEEELEDETLALPIYGTMLDEDLLDLNAGLPANYATLKALPTPNTDQSRFLSLVSAWSSYEVADQLLGALAMFGPKIIQSDKDSAERITDPYAALREQVPAVLSRLEGRILALYAILFPGNPAPVPVTAINVVNAGLAVDPITG